MMHEELYCIKTRREAYTYSNMNPDLDELIEDVQLGENEDDEENHPIDDDNWDEEFEEDRLLVNDDDEGDEQEAEEVKESDFKKRVKFYGKDGTVWSRNKSSASTSSVKLNILFGQKRGPAAEITNMSPRKFFELFLTPEAMELILWHTNRKILSIQSRYPDQRYTHTLTKEELYALFGVMIFAGVTKNSLLPVEDLFSELYAPPLFKATMSAMRFKFLIHCLRYDEWEKRKHNKPRPEDNFVHIRELWNMFLRSCRQNYSPSLHVTVDETMLRFFGNCGFKTYLPAKPDKYGLKIISLVDAKSFYFLNGIPYLGADKPTSEEKVTRQKQKARRPSQVSTSSVASTSQAGTSQMSDIRPLSKPSKYVLDLIEPYFDKPRTVTLDNWFSSVRLADKLAERNWRMTGTMRKSRRELPSEIMEFKRKEEHVSRYLYCNSNKIQKTLCTYVPKPGRVVVLLSTADHSASDHAATGKPLIVEAYNAFKGGVDMFNEIMKSRSCRRKTRRWPLRVLYFILDASAYNSFVLFRTVEKMKRIDFLKALSFELVDRWSKLRLEESNLSYELRLHVRRFRELAYKDEHPVETRQRDPAQKVTMRCYICAHVLKLIFEKSGFPPISAMLTYNSNIPCR